MTQSEQHFDDEEPEPLMDILLNEPNPQEVHREISDLILSSYLSKQNLGRYILSKAVCDIFEPDMVQPCIIIDEAEDSVTTGIADAEGTVLHTAETYSRSELSDFKMPAVAIRAFFDYAGHDFTYNN